MEGLKRISPEEAENYSMLSIYDPNVCTKAVAFMLLPSPIPNPGGSAWEDVTYYANPDSSIERHPLELLLEEWNTKSSKDN